MAQRPYVLLSAAMSADGYLDDASGTRLVLSDQADLDRVDELRAGCDAILVGAQTVRSDNPRLQVHSAARRARREERGLAPTPLRVTITRGGDLDPGARLFSGPPPLVYAAAQAAAGTAARLSAVATVIPAAPAPAAASVAGSASAGPSPAPAGHAAASAAAARDDRPGVGLPWMLADLAARGVGRLMVEGGSRILGQFLAGGLADEFLLAVAPLFVADPAAPRLLTGPRPAGRMILDRVWRTGDMAVLRYLPSAAGGTGRDDGSGRDDASGRDHASGRDGDSASI